MDTKIIRKQNGHTMRHLFFRGRCRDCLFKTDGGQFLLYTDPANRTVFTPIMISRISYTYLLQVRLQQQDAWLHLPFQFFKFQSTHNNPPQEHHLLFQPQKILNLPQAYPQARLGFPPYHKQHNLSNCAATKIKKAMQMHSLFKYIACYRIIQL